MVAKIYVGDVDEEGEDNKKSVIRDTSGPVKLNTDHYSEQPERKGAKSHTWLSWYHDIFHSGVDAKVDACVQVLWEYMGKSTEYNIPEAGIRLYVESIQTRMSRAWVDEVPLYHNFNHGVDVLMQVGHYVYVAGASRMLTALDAFALGIAALGHDVDHPGLNNAYHVNSQAELAIRYSDAAVLEQHSAAVVSQLLREHNVVLNIPEKDFRRLRGVICSTILGTDMSQHFKTMEKLATFVEAEPWNHVERRESASKQESMHRKNEITTLEPEDRKFLCDILLHAADVSNPARPWKLCKKWSDLVCEEFYRQGDKEQSLGLPISPNCNRATSSQSTLSINFSDFIVKPLFIKVAAVLPSLESTAIFCLDDNRQKWVELKENEATEKQLLRSENSLDSPTQAAAKNTKRPGGGSFRRRLTNTSEKIIPAVSKIQVSEEMITSSDVNPNPENDIRKKSKKRKRTTLLDRARGRTGFKTARSALTKQLQRYPSVIKVIGVKPKSNNSIDTDSDEDNDDLVLTKLPSESDSETDCFAVSWQNWIKNLYDFHQSKGVQTLFFVMTILALIGNSIRYAFFRPRADFTINLMLTVFLGLFGIEIALLCLAENGYKFSSFMGFDLVGAASLILDVPWLHGGGDSVLFAGQANSNAQGSARVARAVRLVRFIRFVRLVRLAKLMKFLDCFRDPTEKQSHTATLKRKKKVADASSSSRTAHPPAVRSDQAAMGSRLAEKISRRMMLVVLLVLLVVPYLTQHPNSYLPHVQLLRVMGNMTHAQRVAYVDTNYKRKFDVLYLRIGGYDYVPKKQSKIDRLRFSERRLYEDESAATIWSPLAPPLVNSIKSTKAIHNIRSSVRNEAFLDILLISFISLLLVGSSISFAQVAEDIVVRPVDRMLRLVAKVARALDVLRRDAQQTQDETEVLEHSIGKIQEMLRFGFGATLSGVVDVFAASNVSGFESVRIQAAFVFLDMHNYHSSPGIEVPADAMAAYVSVLAHLVQKAVSEYRGGIARNTGNSFLLVWRDKVSQTSSHTYDDSSSDDNKRKWNGLRYTELPENNASERAFKSIVRCALDTVHCNAVGERAKELAGQLLSLDFHGAEDDEADNSRFDFTRRVFSTLSQNANMFNSARFAQVGEAKRAVKHVERAALKIKNYGCELVFASGLHYGTAVENRPAGVSDDFADCSFISHNVNLAAKLEKAASATYGVTMLMSGQFVSKLAPSLRERTRKIDRAKLKGTEAPVTLHTYDFLPMDEKNWPVVRPAIQNSDLTALFSLETPAACSDYICSFQKALTLYLDGDWSASFQMLEKLGQILPDDTPLQSLISSMAVAGHICPTDWRGYREL